MLLCTAPQEGWLPHKVKGEGLSQDDAKEDAAFEAVKYLHRIGVLDGRFFVAGRQEARRALGLRPSGHGTKSISHDAECHHRRRRRPPEQAIHRWSPRAQRQPNHTEQRQSPINYADGSLRRTTPWAVAVPRSG